MIYEHFRVVGADESILDSSDLVRVTRKGDDRQELDTKWEDGLFSMREVPKDDMLESMFKTKLEIRTN